MPITSPPLCPVLIDRAADLEALNVLLRDAAAGHGRLILLTGDAGIGKTRLLRELEERAAVSGFQRLFGSCTELDRDFPFAPIVDAFRQRRAAAPLAQSDALEVGPHADLLCELLPELQAPVVGGRSQRNLPPAQTKRWLFEAIGSYLTHLARQQPLLVILDDLHWADATTLELLEILPRRLTSARTLVVGAARPDEPNPDLRRLRAALRRSRTAIELSLSGLGPEGVARMMQALLAVPPAPAFAAAVHARTSGNPFYVEELLAASPSGLGWLLGEIAVPETIQDVVLRRVSDLDTDARYLLDVASVIGQQCGFPLLQTASGLSADAALAALRTLVDRGLLVTEVQNGHDLFAFRHALMRDALYEHLLVPQRQMLHQTVGIALEASLPPGTRSIEDTRALSHHFHAAGAWEKSLEYAAIVGAAADRLNATVEAVIHHRRALNAALALGDPRAADLHHRCGLALSRLGAMSEAHAHLEAARALARQQGLDDVVQEATHDLAGLYASRDYAMAQSLAEEALALAQAMGDRRREGLARNRLGNVLTNLLHFDKGRAMHDDARALFAGLDDRWGSADSIDLIGMARYLSGDVPKAREAFGQAAAIFAELGDSERLASALTSRGLYLAVLDGPCGTIDTPEAYRADAAAGLRICQEIAWRSGEAYALVALSSAAIGEGQFGEARRLAVEALAIAEEMNHQQWQIIAMMTLGILETELHDMDNALARFLRAWTLARDTRAEQWAERLAAWIAWCGARGGDIDAPPLSELSPDSSVTRLNSIGQRRMIGARIDYELARGRPDLALQWCDLLLAGDGPPPAATIAQRADALSANGMRDVADAAYREARKIATAVGPRSVLWRVAAGRALLRQGDDSSLAATEGETARSEIEQLAASLDEAERARFLGAPEIRRWVAAAGRRRTADTAAAGGLTRREREVANLVSRGLANKEIARALAIADKTVEMHVSSCLGKLGFASRAQLAVWAVNEAVPRPPPRHP